MIWAHKNIIIKTEDDSKTEIYRRTIKKLKINLYKVNI